MDYELDLDALQVLSGAEVTYLEATTNNPRCTEHSSCNFLTVCISTEF